MPSQYLTVLLLALIGTTICQNVGQLKIDLIDRPACHLTSAVGDTLSVHYTGTFENGTKFDSSLDRGIPFEFVLGEGNVIPGWDQGMVAMCLAEKRSLVVPPHLAYGDEGAGNVIPPGATLYFQVELVALPGKEEELQQVQQKQQQQLLQLQQQQKEQLLEQQQQQQQRQKQKQRQEQEKQQQQQQEKLQQQQQEKLQQQQQEKLQQQQHEKLQQQQEKLQQQQQQVFSTQKPQNQEEHQSRPVRLPNLSGPSKMNDPQLKIETLIKPDECKQTAVTGNRATVHYAGYYQSNYSKFDSSVDRDEPFSFKMGSGQVIPGWEQGIQGMCVGERRRLTIPPHLAYGERGAGEIIPPHSTLIFDVQLLGLIAK